MSIVYTAHASTAVQALSELAASSPQPGIDDPTGEVWWHLLGLAADASDVDGFVDQIEQMDPVRFRSAVLGYTAWSWRTVAGESLLAAAVAGDHGAQAELLAHDRYYGGLAGKALREIMPLDADETRDRFLAALRAHPEPDSGPELARVAAALAAAAAREGWVAAIEGATGFRYVPEPEAERVVVLPYAGGESLVLAQHDDARLIAFGAEPLPDVARRVVELGTALGDESRVAVLRALAAGPSPLGPLLDATGLTRSTLHHHLRVLRAAGLVVVEGNARAYRYALHRHAVGAMSDLLAELLEEER